MTRQRSARWFWVSLGILLLDQAAKFVVETRTAESFRRALIPGFVTLVHSHNPGIAFGLFADARSPWIGGLLIAGSAAVIALLAWLLAAGRLGTRRAQAALALILGGAVGNLVDRVLHGSVTDFFEVGVGRFHWPAFNVADSAIVVGALLLVFELLFAWPLESEE